MLSVIASLLSMSSPDQIKHKTMIFLIHLFGANKQFCETKGILCLNFLNIKLDWIPKVL